MVTLVLICAIVSGVAALRGHKSPLFGGGAVVLYVILQFPAAALMREHSEWTQCIAAAVASVACTCGLILLLPAKNPRAEPKKSSVPFAAIGVVCLLLALAAVAVWFLAMRGGAANSVFLLGGALLLTAALACFRLHKRQAQPSAAEVLRHDTRPPVLFLRSFRSDAARVKPWGSGMLPMYPDWLGKSFEEFLAPAMNETGPMVGLGDPEDYLPTLGASKVYQRDDTWQETVLDYLRRAGLVLILEGDTPGLNWELGQVRRRCSPHRVFLITPTAKFPRTGWREFARLLEGAGFDVPAADVGTGAVVGFDGWFRPVVLYQGATTAKEYARAVIAWQVQRGSRRRVNDGDGARRGLPTPAEEPP
jgi:hypothetical protein